MSGTKRRYLQIYAGSVHLIAFSLMALIFFVFEGYFLFGEKVAVIFSPGIDGF